MANAKNDDYFSNKETPTAQTRKLLGEVTQKGNGAKVRDATFDECARYLAGQYVDIDGVKHAVKMTIDVAQVRSDADAAGDALTMKLCDETVAGSYPAALKLLDRQITKSRKSRAAVRRRIP